MSRILLVASERGLWRVLLDQELPHSIAELQVDAPEADIFTLAGAAEGVAALSSEGRLLLWDAAARSFLEGPSLELGESEPQCSSLSANGTLFVGVCPPQVWQWRQGEPWRELGGMAERARAGRWRGLEAPYEPRVSGLLAHESDLWASISVGGLCRYSKRKWSEVAEGVLPRDQRDISWIEGEIYLATGQGLWALGADGKEPTRFDLPPQAAFAARIAKGSGNSAGLVLAAAPGPPATWRGPDGSRMVVWHFPPGKREGRLLAGPFHGVIRAMVLDDEVVWLATGDGELWRIPMAGPTPEDALIADLPALRDLFLIDELATRG